MGFDIGAILKIILSLLGAAHDAGLFDKKFAPADLADHPVLDHLAAAGAALKDKPIS